MTLDLSSIYTAEDEYTVLQLIKRIIDALDGADFATVEVDAKEGIITIKY